MMRWFFFRMVVRGIGLKGTLSLEGRYRVAPQVLNQVIDHGADPGRGRPLRKLGRAPEQGAVIFDRLMGHRRSFG